MKSGEGGGGPRRQEAERWLGVAGKLLEARDFEGCKQFVEQSVSADPLVPGAEELVAAAEVFQSVEQRLINGHPDYYAVLGLDSSLPSSLDPGAVSLHYQRLSLLLHRDPPTPAFTDAARLVADAWTVLSDPTSKALFDKELELAKPKSKPRPPSPPPPLPPASSPPRKTPVKPSKPSKPQTLVKSPKSAPAKGESSAKTTKSVAKPTNFWTMCTTCCHVHQYGRLCEGQYLLCHSCRRPFFAAAMLEPPPIVPDSDMYYCTWGFFPLGFPGGPGYGGMYGLGSQFGTGPVVGSQPGATPSNVGGESVTGTGTGTSTGTGTPSSLPVKRGRGRPRKDKVSPGTPATPGPGLVNVPVVGSAPAVVMPNLGRGSSTAKDTVAGIVTPSSGPVKRGRGRPRKNEATSMSYTKKMAAKKRINANRKKVVVDMN